ncbi:MAG TPA: hypothetical protein VKR60_15785, partial [Candidatus Sulfotelmatobacter sp.]|nr:hypothetical protein [Candidatus Sulfotelmatobacter sp.]
MEPASWRLGFAPPATPLTRRLLVYFRSGAYTSGTSATSKPNVWNYVALGRQIDYEDSGMIRLDYHFSDRTTSFLR